MFALGRNLEVCRNGREQIGRELDIHRHQVRTLCLNRRGGVRGGGIGRGGRGGECRRDVRAVLEEVGELLQGGVGLKCQLAGRAKRRNVSVSLQ